MDNVCIVGSQSGDEAKSRIVCDLLKTGKFLGSVAFNGGGNAGHTIYYKGIKYELHELPVASIIPGHIGVVGHGRVVNPKKLVEEIRACETYHGVIIDSKAHVVTEEQVARDAVSYAAYTSTGNGIKECYGDKYARIGRRVLQSDFPSDLNIKVMDTLDLLRDHDGWIFEGAQSIMLDIDSPQYPMVSSSHSTFHGMGQGTYFDPRRINSVVGVCKPYLTKAGAGPMPSESERLDQILSTRGCEEVGVTTGRKRRVGWLNLDELIYACKASCLDEIYMTKMDVLNHLKEIPVWLNDKELIVPYFVEDSYEKFFATIENLIGVRISVYTDGISDKDFHKRGIKCD